jgi:hypothetical protein
MTGVIVNAVVPLADWHGPAWWIVFGPAADGHAASSPAEGL